MVMKDKQNIVYSNASLFLILFTVVVKKLSFHVHKLIDSVQRRETFSSFMAPKLLEINQCNQGN